MIRALVRGNLKIASIIHLNVPTMKDAFILNRLGYWCFTILTITIKLILIFSDCYRIPKIGGNFQLGKSFKLSFSNSLENGAKNIAASNIFLPSTSRHIRILKFQSISQDFGQVVYEMISSQTLTCYTLPQQKKLQK